MSTNKAAWLNKSAVSPLEIRDAPYTKPKDNEILVKNCAVAINPIDWMIPQHGTAVMYNWVTYPTVLGHDLAGVVVEVGPNVTRFKTGDRVLGQAIGLDQKRNRAAEGAFQLYTIVSVNAACRIPDNMPFSSAAAIPLGTSTAATALFQRDMLGLALPSLSPHATGKSLIVWGGSTSVGLNAIQLAVAAGYEVYTTCSPRNFSLVRSLGASQAWDYTSPSAAISSIVSALKDKPCAGALAVGTGSAEACLAILAALPSAMTNKFVAAATFPVRPPPARLATLAFIYRFLAWNVTTTLKGWWSGVTWKLYIGTALITDSVLGEKIYGDFLPKALEDGSYKSVPEAQVVGTGLEALQGALEKGVRGVSARKLVVALE